MADYHVSLLNNIISKACSTLPTLSGSSVCSTPTSLQPEQSPAYTHSRLMQIVNGISSKEYLTDAFQNRLNSHLDIIFTSSPSNPSHF